MDVQKNWWGAERHPSDELVHWSDRNGRGMYIGNRLVTFDEYDDNLDLFDLDDFEDDDEDE